MSAVWSWVRISLRRHAVATVTMSLLVGLTGGTALAAAAGARRTATAYPRMIEATHSDGILISSFGPGLLGLYQDIERLPQLATAGKLAAMSISPVTATGEALLVSSIALASVDGRAGYEVTGFKVLAGRLPEKNSENEILINEPLARSQELRPGSHVAMRLFRGGEPKDPHHVRPDEGISLNLTIAGIGISEEEVVPVSPLDTGEKMLLTPAFWKRYGNPSDTAFDGMYVRLKPGVSVPAFQRTVDDIAAGHPEAGGKVLFSVQADQQARVIRAIRPQAAALALFALIAAVVSMLVLGQAVSRQVLLEASEFPFLRAIGATKRQLVGGTLIRVGVVAGTGALFAATLAVLSSPFMPIGPARLAEPAPGFAANAAMLAVGGAAIVFAFLAWTFVPAWRAASRSFDAGRTFAGPPSPSRIAAAVRKAGLSPSASNGVRMALEPGSGRTAVPVRSALVGTALAVAALVASLIFGAAMNRMVSDPRVFGWNWDLMLDAQFGILPTSSLHKSLDNGDVQAWAGGVYGTLVLSGRDVPAVGLDPGRGDIYPTMLDGRPAQSEHEIVLGPKTLRAAHTRIGDTIDVSVGKRGAAPLQLRMRVVGIAVFPSLGRGSFTPTGLGDGAFTVAKPFAEPQFALEQGGTNASDLYNFALVRFAPGHHGAAAGLAKTLSASPVCGDQECGALSGIDRRPADIANYGRVLGTQVALAVLLFALAALTVAHALVAAVRRRYADIAVLKTLGLARRQLSSMIAWQATTYAVIACALGIPGGIALGKWSWSAFAGELGVPPDVRVPVLSFLIPAAATLLLANLAAAFPARTAARVSPAAVLRAE